MAIPTLFDHHRSNDNKKAKKPLKWDIIMSIVALIIIIAYGVTSIIDLLTTVSYEAICSRNVDAKILCDDWSFRQCSVDAGVDITIGAKRKDGRTGPFNIEDNFFCPYYREGLFAGPELYSYQRIDENGQLGEAAPPAHYTCCGQIEQTIIEKAIIWIGIMGGASALIVKLIGVIPPCCCTRTDSAINNVEMDVEEVPVNTV